MKVLVIVDMQNDFVSGALGSKEAQTIVSAVEERIKEALRDGQTLLIFTRDTHSEEYLQTQEGKMLPVEHCMATTDGWQIVEQLVPYTMNAVMVNKPTFGSLELPQVIERCADKQRLEEIELCGLCTDICVVTNALILKTHFPEIPVIVREKLCAGVRVESHRAALDTMKMCQVDVIGGDDNAF